MALMPGAEYVGPIPSSNYSSNGVPKIGTVVHVIVGSAASALSEFKNPAAQLSAHFIICGPGDNWPDGHILQVLDTALAAYAQAAGNYPPTAYIAMEFSGQPTDPMSAAQMASGALIDAWASRVHGFPIVGPVGHGQAGCTTHCNPNGTADPAWGNHVCPGLIRLAQVPAMIAMAQPEPSPQRTEENMIARDNVSGGTWVVRPDANVYTFNGAPYLGPLPKYTTQWGIGTAANPVVGIVSDNAGGFILATDSGGPQPAVYHIDKSGQYAK